MRIIICEQDEEYVDELSKMLKTMAGDEEVIVESYTDTLSAARRFPVQTFDMAFFGPVINKRNGFELGRMLKAQQQDCIFFLVCEDYRYMYESFRCEAFQLLLKSQPAMLEEEFHRALRIYHKKRYEISFALEDGKIVRFLPSDIAYIQMRNQQTIVVTRTDIYVGTFKCYKQVKLNLKDYHFCQVHPRYFVNLEHLDLIRRGEIQLYTGDCIPVSVVNRDTVDEAIQEYFQY